MDPMANSSIFVFPRIMAPAFSRFTTASALKVGTKPERMRDAQVVSTSSVQILSFTATGTPARGPVNSPESMAACTSPALFRARSLSRLI